MLTIASGCARRRRGTAEVRQQLAWLAYAGALTVFWIVMLPLEGLILGSGNTVAGTVIWGSRRILTPVAGIPVACAVAVLRYRLYDLDVVVKKTVVGGLVAAAFTAGYVLVVVGIGAATGGVGQERTHLRGGGHRGSGTPAGGARARQVADRLVYGKRADTLRGAVGLRRADRGTYSTEDVLPSMARMVAEATGAERAGGGVVAHPRHRAAGGGVADYSARLVHRCRTGPRTVDRGNGKRGPARPLQVISGGPSRRGDGGPARHQLAARAGTPAGERLVRDVAAQAGLVLRNVALIEDLRASRQRIVSAADEARRGLERDLHDGAQQQLVALKITLGLARQVAASSLDEIDDPLADT